MGWDIKHDTLEMAAEAGRKRRLELQYPAVQFGIGPIALVGSDILHCPTNDISVTKPLATNEALPALDTREIG